MEEQENKPIEYDRKRTWKKTPTVYQMEMTECGAASLAMILGYYGCSVGLEQLRLDCGVSRDGCNAGNILKAGRQYGLQCRGFAYDVEKLLQAPTPCIIHWNFNHFVVFEGVKGGFPYINDPGNGRRKLDWQELEDCYTGITLTFKKTENVPHIERRQSIFKFAAGRIHNERHAVTALIIAGLVLVIPGMAVSLFSQFFVDYILDRGYTSWFVYLALFMAGTLVFQLVFYFLRAALMNRLQLKLMMTSGYNFLRHLMSLPISFYTQRYAGDLSQRTEDNTALNNFLTGQLAQAVLNMLSAVFYLIVLIIYSPVLTLVGLAGCALTLLITLAFSNKLADISKKYLQDSGKTTGVLFSGLSIIDTLKAAGSENEFTSRLLGYWARMNDSEQKVGRMQQMMDAVPTAISELFNIAVLTIGGVFVINGNMTAGMLIAFTQLLTSFTAPVNELVGFFRQIKTTQANVSRVEDIENYKAIQTPVETDDSALKEKLSGRLELKDISFGYRPYVPPFIEDFDLTLEPGRITALVGRSASGKSTIGKLISGLNDPWSGEVLYDGKPRLQIPSEIFSASVSTVCQDIHLFKGTIKENLTLWNPLVSDQDLVRACEDACIYDIITRLPGDFSYVLSESGSNLSGGQRQRLEIAGALVSNPTLLVMDEATSALDPITEKKIMDNIRRRGCSCILVAHRLSTIRDADEILVLDHGTITERGSHEELLKKNGAYAALLNIAG